jgi:CRP-like cAMP-binding protein
MRPGNASNNNNPEMVSPSLFREFVPTHTLPPSDRVELARHSHVVAYQPGQEIFHRGEAARSIAYLIAGEIELVSERGTRRLAAATDEARHPVASGARYLATATALRPCQLLFVDREQMDLLLTWAQTGSVEVQELDEAEPGDWMAAMLRNPAFHRIPPANIAQIIACVEQIEVDADQDVIRQGAPGDFYYILTEGRCQVLSGNGGEPREIDQIGPGRGFGEEALVSGDPRNATVRTLTRCSLVRLAAADFARLLRDPLVHHVDLESLPRSAVLVDVRLPEEFAHGHLPGAVNVPLRALRSRAGSLDQNRPLAVYCDTGRRSASATFLLRERGFDAHLVRGGVSPERLTANDENQTTA